ncbi:MAG TPA: hypothetical protein DIC34_19915 [Treponema sp.]|nr:MAG: hypothetical protein A2Y36_01740 [Treponema sp. GWA1_62_8]OHE68366.1 MAG: hypothetical protein A2001_06200 [Treponema sp. GWC1_61_84]HCM28768.1 hypothetical protein [Treponema sp.]
MHYFQFPGFRSLHADNCGCAMLSPPWIHPRRKLGSSVLIVGYRGRVPIVNMDEEYWIAPGTVTLLPAGQIHYGSQAISAPAMYFWFHFTTLKPPVIVEAEEADTIFSDPAITSHKLDGAALLPLHFILEDAEPVHQIFHDLLYEQENPSYTSLKFQIMFQGLIIRLTECVIAGHQPGAAGSTRTSVAYDIVTWLTEHLTDPNLSIKMISAAIGLNPDYAGRRFKETMGLSVGEYVLKKRVEMAIRFLQETGETVERIAGQCGFGTVRNFLRQFKAERGMTPTEIRKRHRIMHVNSL